MHFLTVLETRTILWTVPGIFMEAILHPSASRGSHQFSWRACCSAEPGLTTNVSEGGTARVSAAGPWGRLRGTPDLAACAALPWTAQEASLAGGTAVEAPTRS